MKFNEMVLISAGEKASIDRLRKAAREWNRTYSSPNSVTHGGATEYQKAAAAARTNLKAATEADDRAEWTAAALEECLVEGEFGERPVYYHELVSRVQSQANEILGLKIRLDKIVGRLDAIVGRLDTMQVGLKRASSSLGA